MRYFQEFESNRVAVIFRDKKERNEFLKLCDEKGLKWCGKGESATSYNVPNYVKVIYCHYGNMQHNDILGNIRCGYEIVPASEFLQPQITIEIFQAKQTVVCLKKQDGKVIARGVARCSKDDVFNFDCGSTIAFKRMLVDSNNKELMEDFIMPKSDHIQGDAVDAVLPKIKKLKDGTKIIKQDKYEVGDKVLIEKKFVSGTQNDHGEMDKWLGKIMTVRTSWNCTYRMIEDENELFGSGWSWNIKDIEGKVIE